MLEWGLAQQPRDSEQVSGDLHVVQQFVDGTLIGVVDGLGHGPEAAAASGRCKAALVEHAGTPLRELVTICHELLRGTRGATLSLAVLNGGESAWVWLGVGNVAGVLVRAGGATPPERLFLVPRNGLVGVRLPRLSAETVRAAPGDTMILATDGIRSDFSEALIPSAPPQKVAEAILARHAKGTDDALVLVARIIEENRERFEA